MKKILVIFKTHLDVGFTDFACEVVKKYNENYIPRAIRVARELAERGCKEGFTWTTGSWLIYQYLEQANEVQRQEMEEAIRNKWIRWHAIPTTTNTEGMNADLFNYGLSLSAELDARYGVKTIGAKMTDVPGHTRGIIPLLADAGVEFLHIGINPAATAPNVPDIFRWRSPQGKEITVMYHMGEYGSFKAIPGTDTGVLFAHTGDNKGPSSPEEIEQIYADLHAEYPEAEVVAADLSDLALALRSSYLPLVTKEIGDAWIHGVGTDPRKQHDFRALLRLAEELSEEEKRAMYKHLILVPEHTCSLNEQVWLVDTENYSREYFEAVRGEERYLNMERSWQEQRDYILQAAEALKPYPSYERAKALLCEYRREEPDFSAMERIEGKSITLVGWNIAWNERGAVCRLEKDGKVYADGEHLLGRFRYEAFSEKEVNAFMDRYLKPHMRDVEWAYDDFGKRGLGKDMPEYYSCDGSLTGAYTDGRSIYLTVEGEKRANELYGCPARMNMMITPSEDSVSFDFAWYDKPANRIPEALWLEFDPVKPLTAISKLGEDVHPLDVVYGGSREMHGTDGILRFEDITLELPDTPLVSVEKPNVYSFRQKTMRDNTKGVWVNLFNNMWGTNFPMWYEDDARFRVIFRNGK